MQVLAKRPVRDSHGCSQLLEGVVSSKLLPMPGSTQSLLPQAWCSRFWPSSTCPHYPATPLSWGSPRSCPHPMSLWHSLLMQTFPLLLPVLCSQASLPTLCSLNGQVPCSVSFWSLVGKPLSMTVFIFPEDIITYFPKGTSSIIWPSPNSSLYNLLQGFSKSSPRPPESRPWVWARNSQCIVCHF